MKLALLGPPVQVTLLGERLVAFRDTTGKELAESAAAGHTTLVKTTWSGGNGKGPIEAQGLGRVTSPSVLGATWLGLNRNAAYSYLGAINDFTKHGIVWDRVAIEAGKTSNSAPVTGSVGADGGVNVTWQNFHATGKLSGNAGTVGWAGECGPRTATASRVGM